jgi:hypothetical protein
MRWFFVLLLCPSVSHSGEDNWWSLQPLKSSPIPKVESEHPVDALILAKLNEQKLTSSPLADRRTLIRRLTYDLHGLPPTPEEVERFLADRSVNAYESLVDRLLASPRYGERWGRHWLDVVPFADTHGYDKDKRRDFAWPYRDYVIRSFNEDKPYSRFIQEQLAGDVLFPGDPQGVMGTGFIAAGPWDFVGHVELREGTVAKEKTRVIDRDDMVANTFSTFQSLTVHCARCHNHKFDPISQKDYYRLQAVFAGVERGNRPIPLPQAEERLTRLRGERQTSLDKIQSLEGEVRKRTSPETQNLDREITQLRETLSKLPAPEKGGPSPSNGYHSAVHPRADATCWVQIDLGESRPLERVRLYPARPTDFPDSPGFGFPLRFKLEASNDSNFAEVTTLFTHLESDFVNPKDEPFVILPKAIQARYLRITATRLWKRNNDFVFALGEVEIDSGGKNIASSGKVTASETIDAGRWHTKFLVDGYTSRNRLPDGSDPKVAQAIREREQLLFQLKDREAEREQQIEKLITAEEKQQLLELKQNLQRVEQQLASEPTSQLIYAAVPQSKPRTIHLLRRGDVLQKRDEVTPGGLSCLTTLSPEFDLKQPDQEGQRRAALAKWISSPENPLTWRSMANRVWHYHFGKGLVDTPNDFGANGSLPTQPELLDFLALQLREHQSLKKLHRLIVTSRTYQQVSTHQEVNAKIDGENRYLWRMNRTRLDAESLRDSVLTISGKMDWKMGGPGYELFLFKDDHSPIYDHTDSTKGNRPEAWRRTIYRFTVRSVPNPFIDCLDGADPNTNTPRRNQTLTALQALTMLNDSFLISQANYLAERLQIGKGDVSTQIDTMFRLCLSRPATREESDLFQDYIGRHGLPNACRLMWNLNEFVFVD